MPKSTNIICLDVGEKRIGVAIADSMIRIAIPLDTIDVDGHEKENIMNIIKENQSSLMVVGYPRNQSGETTKQTEFVENFIESLELDIEIVYQDESLTSVLAEKYLEASKKPFEKKDIDKKAAAMILQDFLEINSGRK